MVEFDIKSKLDIDPIISEELIELKEIKQLMWIVKREGLIGWLNVESSHPISWKGCSIPIWSSHHLIGWGGIFYSKWCTHKER